MHFSWVLIFPLSMAAICPMERHEVCNPNDDDHKCVCSVAQSQEKSVPEQSCNNMISRDLESLAFPAVSVVFKLDESVEGMDEWPQEGFREAISSSLRFDEDDILILRASCQGTEDRLTVQFAVLKKDLNETEIPYDKEDFIDAESIATRMKAMGHLSQIADLDVDEIEFTEELVDIEFLPDNSALIFQAIGTGIGFAFMFVLGFWFGCRNRDYSDDLQKA